MATAKKVAKKVTKKVAVNMKEFQQRGFNKPEGYKGAK